MMTKLRTLLALAALVLGFAASAQVPQLINYQGRVAVGAVNFDGPGQFKFALVNPAGTTTYWSNDGSSVAGSQPAAAVALPVTRGLYSLLLGDTALANMTAIPVSVWANADVRLRVWFNDGTNGFQRLTPDQRLAPSGYLSDGAVTAAKLAAGAVDLGSAQVTGILPAANGGAAGANSALTMLSGLTHAAVTVTAVTANPTGAADTTELTTATAHGFSAGQLINLVGFNGPGGSGDTSGNFALNSHSPQTTVSAVGLTANTFRIVEGIVTTAQNVGGTGGASAVGDANAALRDSPALTISASGDIYGSETGVIYVKVGNRFLNDLSTGAMFESTDNASPPNIRRAWLMSAQGNFDVGPALRVLNGDTLGKGVFALTATYGGVELFGQGVLGLHVGAGGAVALPELTGNGFLKTNGGTGTLSVDTTVYQTALTFTGTANNLIVTTNGGSISLASRVTSPQPVTIAGPAAPVTWTTPAGSFTLARTDAAQTFTGAQTFSGTTTLGSAGTPVKNLRHGRTAALVGGSRTVADPGCTLNTRYFFTVNTLGTVSFPGTYYVSARAVGVSFTVISNRNDDTSIMDWMAVEP